VDTVDDLWARGVSPCGERSNPAALWRTGADLDSETPSSGVVSQALSTIHRTYYYYLLLNI
jgi:hypothetical protein